ncbi:hypothetical protein [Algoriphagus persicinus]|uniref:hypothetical protein n=1 Tax=Algoriphagus persicinus TaxID=3108754 RepID=UPI002B3E357A|nr:hypothetical protein [Algoriphagus sp. E1-3-M2]MEB2785262.1 hypothetical protein [Algoriphagus sp. E1-3-M2]
MLTSENKVFLKELLLEECLFIQRSLLNDFTVRIEELREFYDPEFSISRGGVSIALSEINFIEEELEFAKEEMRILNFLKSNLGKPHETPELGAVVVTDKVSFFISVSIEEFIVREDRYFGISTRSPIFKAMRGKSKFETFAYGSTNYLIKDIF